MNIRRGIEIGNLTDTGCNRGGNEDYYCYAEPESDEEFRRKGRLVVVADGMGGHEAGELASRVAVDVVRSRYLSSDMDPKSALVEAFTIADDENQQVALHLPEHSAMGATCTAV